MPLGITELCRRIGDDHIRLQPLLDVITNVTTIAKPKRRGAPYHPGVRITFLTDQITCGEIATGECKMVPLLLWLPKELVDKARAEHKAEFPDDRVRLNPRPLMDQIL